MEPTAPSSSPFRARAGAGQALRTIEASVALPTGPTLHYVERGPAHGEPVLLLHGFTDSSFSFARLLPLLPSDLRLLAPDQRGHGRSSRHLPTHAMADLAADAVAFLDALAIDRATIVGHCLGGLVAQRLAIDHPERVRRLVLIASSTRPGNEPVHELLAAVRTLADPVEPGFVREFQRSTLFGPVPEAFFDRVCAESLTVPARVWRQLLEDFALQDTTPAVGWIKAPTLILWGDRDTLFPRLDQEALARRVPGATLRVLPGVGHAAHWERPDLVAGEMVGFLSPPRPPSSRPPAERSPPSAPSYGPPGR